MHITYFHYNLPEVYCHYDNIVSTLSEELGEVHAGLLVLLFNFAKHQTKVKVVKAQNGHQTVEQNALNFVLDIKK